MARAPRLRRTSIYHLIAIAIVVIGLAGGILSFRELRRSERAAAEIGFYRRASVLHARLSDMLSHYEDALHSLRATFTLEGGVTPAEFDRIAQNLVQRNPGVQAFEWIPRVPADGRAAAEAALSRRFGRPVTFTEIDAAGNLVPAPERDDYDPITYVYPFAGNEQALGYNLQRGATEADLRHAMQTRQMVLTSQIKLVQEARGKKGIVMIWPVHRPNPAAAGTGAAPEVFVGFVQGVFRVHDMLETIRMRTWGPGSILDILFVDSSEPDPAQRVLYYRPNDDRALDGPPPTEAEFSRGLSQEYTLPLGGRNWKLIFRPRAGWMDEQVAPLRWVRGIGILSITGLLAGLSLVLGRRTAVIAQQVADRTAELTESRRQFSSLLHALPGMAYRVAYGEETKIIFVSVGVETLTGHPADDFISGRAHFRDLIHPDDVERVRVATRTALSERREVEVEYRLFARDGMEKWVLSRGRGLYDENGRPLFLEGLAIDITARKKAEAAELGMERRLLESQKLESLGLLAGGIAHDFNNILTGILGNASLARLKLGEESPALTNVHKIELASARAAELCQQMLSYSGKSSFLIEPVELSRLVQETLPLLNVSLSSRARLHLDLNPHRAVAQGDATQLRQIVMNLVINAADAMTEHTGDIYVATGARSFPAEFVHSANEGAELPGGQYVFLEVRDNGCGMTPETMARIFDPFFTTKFAGRGLGLAAVRGIVRGHHGALHVVSKPGKGSTFTLLLPPGAGQPVPETKETPGAAAVYTGNVLVIDDEAPVRDAAAELLKTFGFSVVTAQDGAEGIAQFALNPPGYALVLLDLTMPTLSGEETLTTLRAIAPEVRVLLISGYSENSRVTRLTGAGPLRFMQKPFTREDLERKLHELLG
ncbi:MAG: sensor hybrid histidine kinase [Verrucomicrobia bacterium]|nr:sensor hybrid histidine kinase [Verrucomicrobiota bacterium]